MGLVQQHHLWLVNERHGQPDPLTLAHFLLDNGCPPRFLAKQALFEVPVVGRIVAGAGQIPVKRGSVDAARSLEPAVEALAKVITR